MSDEDQPLSKRKGGPRKKKTKTLNLAEGLHKKLGDYAQRINLDMVSIVDMLIESGIDLDLYDPDWKENREKALRVTEARASVEGACHRLATGKNKKGVAEFSCVAYSEEGVVRLKKLGKTLDIREAQCFACGEDKKYKEGTLAKDKKIAELETAIQRKAKHRNKVPICNGGAILTNEGTAFRSCRKRPGHIMEIETACRKLSASGTLPCALFAEVELAEGPL